MYDVVPNFDTSIHPTPSDPPDPPEQPQAPELNDGDSEKNWLVSVAVLSVQQSSQFAEQTASKNNGPSTG